MVSLEEYTSVCQQLAKLKLQIEELELEIEELRQQLKGKDNE